jgi:type II secretory pathway component PulF
MPRYRYVAADIAGNRLEGELDANSSEQVDSQLRAQGKWVERVTLVEPRGGLLTAGRLSNLDVAEFTRHLAGLNRAGLPLPSGVRALGDELASAPLRQVLQAVAGDLEAGRPLHESVEAQGARFPRHLRGLILAGASSGRLGEALEQFARYHHIDRQLKRKLWLSMAYPLMLVGSIAVLFIFVCTVIVQDFAKIFSDFNFQLPGITVFLIDTSHSISAAGPWYILGLLAAALLVWILGASLGGPGWRHSLSSPIPLIGPLLRWTTLVEFSHLLALLLESELPLPVALQLTGDGIRDADIASTCRGMRKLVETGMPLSDSMERMPQFPASLPRILRWAEESHSLPGALHLAGDMYEARARAQATFVGVACTLITIIFVLWGAALLVVALFLPLVQLISKLA